MTPAHRTNRRLALGCLVLALVIAVVWIPLDVQTGLIETVRRQVSVGDSLAPMLAALVIGLGGVLLWFQQPEPFRDVSVSNLVFLAALLGLCLVSFTLMRWAGPAVVAVVNLVSGDDLSYRMLRATAPWKYIGFFLGGSVLVTAMIATLEGRLSARAVVIAVLATSAMIVLYDVPFDDLVLPPNGDV